MTSSRDQPPDSTINAIDCCRSTIRLWSLSKGDAVHVLYGHDSFVYSLAAIPDSAGGGLVSGGEDRTMRVWRGEYSLFKGILTQIVC